MLLAAPRRLAVAAGALLGASAVMLGAFGAHALSGRLSPQQAGWWRTAVDYQMWHALALLGVGALALPRARLTAILFGVGTLIFSGTLYAMALGAPHWLGAITPVGGLLLIGGWLLLAWSALRGSARQ
jgi:uncharacterized membrane protein YgdD (TMEM256/DUF423 family)